MIMTLSRVLRILEWENYYGIYLSIDGKNAQWVNKTDLCEKYDWSKYEVVKITRKLSYDLDNSKYLLRLKTIKEYKEREKSNVQ